MAHPRTQAKTAGLLRYNTGQPCKRGHVADRLVSNGACCECALANKLADYRANVDQRRATSTKWKADNAEHVAAYDKATRARDPERTKENLAEWKANNRHRVTAYERSREIAKTNATPVWSEREAIEQVYALAAFMTKTTGVLHHVDHIVPLQGKTVRGLHVAANLQVLPATVNQSKSNRVWPDMPEELTNGN